MEFEKIFRKKVAPEKENLETAEATDTGALRSKLETVTEEGLTPVFMKRGLLPELYKEIQGVEDAGERSVLEGKYDKAASSMWREIAMNGVYTGPMDMDIPQDSFALKQRNLADAKDFPIFDIETRQEILGVLQDRVDFMEGKKEFGESVQLQNELRRREEG